MQTRDGRTFLVIHEANLVDYARMFLHGTRSESRTLTAANASSPSASRASCSARDGRSSDMGRSFVAECCMSLDLDISHVVRY